MRYLPFSILNVPESSGASTVPDPATSKTSRPLSGRSGIRSETREASMGPATVTASAFFFPMSSEPWIFRSVPSPLAWNSSKTTFCWASTILTSPDV